MVTGIKINKERLRTAINKSEDSCTLSMTQIVFPIFQLQQWAGECTYYDITCMEIFLKLESMPTLCRSVFLPADTTITRSRGNY